MLHYSPKLNICSGDQKKEGYKMESKKIRVYGKELQTWVNTDEKGRTKTVQTEYSYKEYNVDTMQVVNVGSEDFSPERLNNETEYKWLWVWDGEKLNKGGHRWFDCIGLIRYRKSEKKTVKEFYKNKYQASDIQLR